MPMRKPPVGPRLSAHDFSKNLPSCAARPGVKPAGTLTNVPLDVLVAVDAHEVAHEGRETRAREEPALAALETPVLVISEVDVERDLRVRARRADLIALESAELLDQTKFKTPSVRGRGPIAHADLEHPMRPYTSSKVVSFRLIGTPAVV